MMLQKKIDKINEIRRHHQEDAHFILDEMMFKSLEGDEDGQLLLLDDLQTTFQIIWNFDRKLEEAKREESYVTGDDG